MISFSAPDAPAGSKLAFYFDTTAVAYDQSKGDKNNWAVYVNMWSKDANDWKSLKKTGGDYVYSRTYLQNGELKSNKGHIGGEDPGEWIVSFPADAKGYIVLEMGDYELKDCSDIKFLPEWGWNDNAYGQTLTFSQFGYIAPEQPDTPAVTAPEGLVVVNSTPYEHIVNDGNTNESDVISFSAPDAPAGSQLAFYFDTTAIAYDQSKGDKNNWAAHVNMWSKDANDWKSLKKTGGNYVYSRTYLQNGELKSNNGHIVGEDPDEWIVSFPADAKGYIVLEMGDYELKDCSDIKFLPEWGWNDNAYGQTLTFSQFGYIAPKQPDQTIDTPPTGFVTVNAAGLDLQLVEFDEAQDGYLNNAYFENFSATDTPAGSKLVFYFDTTAIPSQSDLGERDSLPIYVDVLPKDAENAEDSSWINISYNKDANSCTRIFTRDGVTHTVTAPIQGEEPSWAISLPVNATGYLMLDIGATKLSDISAFRLRPEWNWNRNVYGKTIKFRNIGYVRGSGSEDPDPVDPDKPDEPDPSDFPFVPEPTETPSYYGTNYVVTKGDLQSLVINEKMTNDLVIDLSSNRSAPAGAKAIAFRYNTTGIVETRTDYTDRGTHGSYWCLNVDGTLITGNIDNVDSKFVQNTQVYYWREQVMENSGYIDWLNTLPVNGIGYVLIPIDALQSNAQKFLNKNISVADVTSLVMKQEWGWNEDMFNKTIRITDVGYVMDPEAFVAAYKDAFVPDYQKGVLEAKGEVTLSVDAVEGTFADLSWTAYEGANRYLINVYDKDGAYLTTERTRKTKMTLEGLSVSTDYTIQVVPVGENDTVLAASNAVDVRTLEANTEAYMKDFLEYTEELKANSVTVSNGTAAITWDWLDGVEYYAVHLYEKDGDTLTFVSRTLAKDGVGEVAISALEDGKTYVAQIVSYDVSDSIIYAYAPTDEFSTKDSGNNNPGTGVATCTGALLLAALLSGGIAAATRKRR